jgi:hypothetical protein
MEASYGVVLSIAMEKRPHTIAETLMKRCAMEMAKLMCGKDAKIKIAQTSVSNDS